MKRSFLAAVFAAALMFSAASSYSQDEQKIKDAVKTVYENMFSTGDFTGVEKYIDENIVDHTPDQGQAPGLEGLKGAFRVLRTAFPDLKFKVTDIIVSGGKTTILSVITGTNTGEIMGMPPTGKKVDYSQLDLVYFNSSNKAVERWGYFDVMKFMSQLGLMK